MRTTSATRNVSVRGVGVNRCRAARPLAVLALAASGLACSAKVSLNVDAPNFSDASAGFSPPGPVSSGPNVQPTFGPTVVAQVPPPPISGGTLLATRDGNRAIAADGERDTVYVVDLKSQKVDFAIGFTAGDEPGRLVEDGAGRIHVALRGGGALATIDPSTGALTARRSVCAAPRGVAWDSATDLVWVACATGELVALPAGGGPAARSLKIERDLRDVVVGNGTLAVTKFRSAELLRIANDGTIARRDLLPSPTSAFASHVAWRAMAGPAGTVVAVHQAESTTAVQTHVQGGYGAGGGCGGVAMSSGASFPPASSGSAGSSLPPSPSVFDDAGAPVSDDAGPSPIDSSMPNGFLGDDAAAPGIQAMTSVGPTCLPNDDGGPANNPARAGFFANDPLSSIPFACLPSSIVVSILTALDAGGRVIVNTAFPGVLPVDVAVSPDGSSIAVVAPGNAFSPGLATVFVFSCGSQSDSTSVSGSERNAEQPVAVAFVDGDRLLVQTRQPAEIRIYGRGAGAATIPLSSISRADTGQDVFHTQAGGLIACASCHPEGGDDGNVWNLDGNRRRTPSLRGTISGTAPYHWPGDQADLNVLVDDVYTVRMSGALLPRDQKSALTGWVENIPPPPASKESIASQRGKTLFDRADVGCAGCHSGAKFTNNQTVDVGTGGAFQVPPLIGVAWRTPLMHDGCAATLADRFGACSTRGHGSIASLSAADVSDLVAYLETL